MLIYPEIRHKARAVPAAVLGVTITMLVYLILTVMAMAYFRGQRCKKIFSRYKI